jgi:hypothetical protein
MSMQLKRIRALDDELRQHLLGGAAVIRPTRCSARVGSRRTHCADHRRVRRRQHRHTSILFSRYGGYS